MNTVESEHIPLAQDGSGLNTHPNSVSHSLLSQERMQKFDLLVHLISNLSRPIVLCGPDGIGKTTLLHEIQRQSHSAWLCCFIDSSPTTTFEAIRDQVAKLDDINSQHTSVNGQQENLAERIKRIEKNGKLLVLLIDDSGVLIPGLIKAICEFAESHKALRLVFAIRPDHLHVKTTSDFALENCHIVDLPPLTEIQSGEFMQNLSANPQAALSFEAITPVLIQKVYKETHGIPGDILTLLSKIAKISGFNSHSQSSSTALIIVAIFVLTGALIAFNSNYFDGSVSSSISAVDQSKMKPPRRTEIALSSPIKIGPPKSDPEPMVVENEGSSMTINAKQSTTTNELKNADVPVINVNEEPSADTASSEPIEPTTSASQAQTITATSNENLDNLKTQPIATTTISDPIPEPKQNLEDHIKTFPKSDKAANETITKLNDQATAKKPVKETSPQPLTTQVKSDADVLKLTGINGADWLLKQNPEHWSLQIIVVSRLDALKAFIRKHRTFDSLVAIRSKVKNKTLYTLFHGSYATLKDAKTAAKKLPASFRKSWPRKYKSIHREIKTSVSN